MHSAHEDEDASPPLDRLLSLEWRVRHAARSALAGDYRSVFRGRGAEFDQVVPHAWGDDPRDIDWNVTARLGEPYRRRFVEERDVCLLLLFEDSPALQFGSAGRTRRVALLEFAALLLLLGAAQRDRVGVLYTAPGTTWLRRPLAGREATRQLAARLLSQPAPPLDGPGAVEEPWSLLTRAAPKHSVLLWLGPFHADGPPDDWPRLQRRHQTFGFRADDPWDAQLPARTRLPVFDPLAGRITEFDTAAPASRRAHATWAAEREARFAALFPEPADRHLVPTTTPAFDSLLEFFHTRAHAGTGSR